MNVVVTLVIALAALAAISAVTYRRQQARQRNPVSRKVRKLSAKHGHDTGVVVEVFWPVASRGSLRAATAVEPRRFDGMKVYFVNHISGRRGPFWVEMEPGEHLLELEVGSGKRKETDEATVKLKTGEHALLLCWPSKRRVATPARARTAWALHRL